MDIYFLDMDLTTDPLLNVALVIFFVAAFVAIFWQGFSREPVRRIDLMPFGFFGIGLYLIHGRSNEHVFTWVGLWLCMVGVIIAFFKEASVDIVNAIKRWWFKHFSNFR